MSDGPVSLQDYTPQREYYVGIDSDGCAFDTMELKHKECFIPNIIKHFGLQTVSKYARQAAEFVNLYSKWRGINRFPALKMTFELLTERPEVERRGVASGDLSSLTRFIESGLPLGNPALQELCSSTDDPDLKHILQWSEAVNDTIADMVHGVAPFPLVRESLEKLAPFADMMCVSATPVQALTAEWEEHAIAKYVRMIVGQEVASKKEAIRVAAGSGYEPTKVLMVGDAPGDMAAAHTNNALFYPVVPGEEEESWERFYAEAIDRFRDGTYAGEYEKQLIAHFETKLPSTPPWKR